MERKKCDPEKLAIAIRLRKETSLTIKVIAARLHLGTTRNAAERLHALRTDQLQPAAARNGTLHEQHVMV